MDRKMGRHSVGHSIDEAGKRYNNETDRKKAQPSRDLATFCRSLDRAGRSRDCPNRKIALDSYLTLLINSQLHLITITKPLQTLVIEL